MLSFLLLISLFLLDPTIRAEMNRNGTIRVMVDGIERPLDKSAYTLEDARGNAIPIGLALPNGASDILLTPAAQIDHRRNFKLTVSEYDLQAWVSHDGWFRSLSSSKELGANISEDGNSTSFKVFAPRAESVVLYLYENHNDPAAKDTISMRVDEQGVWEAEVDGNLHGTWYDFTVHGSLDPGNHFYETTRTHASDPYARVQYDSWGRSRVWAKTTPATPLADGIPDHNSLIAYEVHVVDFTDNLPVEEHLKGTIPAMVRSGLRNSRGHSIGFDHLVDLGINVVHLLPMQEFLHYPDEAWKRSFGNDPRMKELGIDRENYQWGYRTTHAFAIESKYRSKDTEPGAEREQFRDLVQAFHDKGIAVIVDLVFNHTGENMERQHHNFNFNAFDKLYYYRTKDLEHNGVFGNETKSEDRPMVQRWIIDQCLALINEFGVDGFRIDLGGLTDQQTLLALREAVGPDIIIYGEPWISSNDPAYNANPDWAWYKADAPIMYFQDDARNAFKGPVSEPKDKTTDRGYAGGDTSQRERVMLGLTNGWPEEGDPVKAINYLDIHDNWALADQFASKDFDGRFGVDEGPYRIATTLLFTSMGPLVLHGGSEFMRSKGLAGKESYTKEVDGITLYFHGAGDTYNLRAANRFDWENIGKTARDRGSYANYREMLDFWKGMIALRNSDIGEVFRRPGVPPEGYYDFITPDDESMLGYMVDDKVLVLVNTSDGGRTFRDVLIPDGRWRMVSNGQRVNLEGMRGDLRGGTVTVTVPAHTAMVWVRY
jgi:pullulanase